MSKRQTFYTYDKELNGHEPCDIISQLYGDDAWRTVLLNKQDFESLAPWQMCSLLNNAYERGRTEYAEELRRFLGVKD